MDNNTNNENNIADVNNLNNNQIDNNVQVQNNQTFQSNNIQNEENININNTHNTNNTNNINNTSTNQNINTHNINANSNMNTNQNMNNNFNVPNRNYNSVKEVAKKTRYKYLVYNSQGSKMKGYIDAYNKKEVEAFLNNEGYRIISITISKDIYFGSEKIKISELAFMLTQLSTYLKAGISLIDAIGILEHQTVDARKRRVCSNIKYELVKGENLSNALASQGNVFPQLLINMIKTSEMTGDLPSILDDMTEYYTTLDRTRKAAVSAMIYPTIIFVFSLMVIAFIFTFVIPQFVDMFNENDATIPAITTIVIKISNFLTTKGLYLIGAIGVILLCYALLFKHVRSFRKAMQSFYMKLPVVGDIIIYKEVAMFTKTFASLLNHDVFITDSMAILSNITSNEVYSDIISDSIKYLQRGARISDSFKGKWAFPVVAYEMLQTGENTGRLATMMEYVAKYYDDLHSNYIKRLNTFIEPVMIVFLAVVVGIVVLSVVVPMFSMYGQI